MLDITEIVIGTSEGKAFRYAPAAKDQSILDTRPLGVPATRIAETVRSTLARSKRDRDDVPFVMVRAHGNDVEWAVADDAAARIRTLEHSIGGRLPLIVEASTTDPTDDPKLELILGKLADSMRITDPDAIAGALTGVRSSTGEAVPEDESEYRRAYARAADLAKQVRAIDDQMTASVVPGWLFVACGVGSIGILMTAVTFFNPELRIYVVPAMLALLFLGLGAYAWRSFKELQTRGALQNNRAQLRAEREEARAKVRGLAEKLEAAGKDPDAVVASSIEGAESSVAPVITHDLTSVQVTDRQRIVFVDGEHPGALQPELLS